MRNAVSIWKHLPMNAHKMENSESSVLLDVSLPERSSISYSTAFRHDEYSDCRYAEQFYTGSLTGIYKGTIQHDEEVAVYVYRKGQFCTDAEITGTENVKFQKAIASTMIAKSGPHATYRINLLEEGEFELHFVMYQEDQRMGCLVMQAELNVHSESGMDLSDVKVKAGTVATVNVQRKDI